MAYLPNTDTDRRAMLDAAGVASVRELFASIPQQLLDPATALPPALSEQELVAEVSALATANRPLSAWDSFLGAGVYRRFSPAIVRGTISRPEFYTAYTPYQAEASQGTLQTIFEFQSMIAALTALDVANASLYDGATAAAEAMMLAVAHTGRSRVAVSSAVHPDTMRVISTFALGRDVEIDVLPTALGLTTTIGLDERHAALLVAQPNFNGNIEGLQALADAAHAVGALAVASVDPIACTVLVPPGDAGFDVAVGEGQPRGLPASFGGPHVGFIAVTQALLRRMPGRLVGMTTDHAGDRAYALTLQTREQHIRREKATSNICTNHALMALAATVYMAHMGAGGMARVAEVSAQRAHVLADRLTAIAGFDLTFPETPFLWEFVLTCPGSAEALVTRLREHGIIAGLPMSRVGGDARHLLVCCTEMTDPASINRYAEAAASTAATPMGARA